MKKTLTYLFLFLVCFAHAQFGLFINGADASLRVDSTSFLSIHGDFQNSNCDPINYVRFNGTLYLSGNLINNDTLKFVAVPGLGNAKKARIVFQSTSSYPSGFSAIIGGSIQPQFWEVEIDKGISGSLTLNTNIKCLDTLNFKTGSIYMNGYKWNLKDPVGAPMVINNPFIKNERNACQFLPSSLNDTGLVIYKTIFNYSVNMNPGNIGIEFTGLLNTGSPFTVKRGFKPQVNSAKGSILKYFDIDSPGHSLVNNVIKVNYMYNDMLYFSPGYFNLPSLGLYVSPMTDMDWSGLPSTIQTTLVSTIGPVLNGIMTASLSDLSLPNIVINPKLFRITISDPNCPSPPVSGLLLDTVHICVGNTMILDAGNSSAIANSNLKWEWNTTVPLYTRTLSVNPNTTFQKYKVVLKDVRGCITKDSVIIAPQAPYPQISYLNHLNSCLGDSVTIKDTVKIISGTYTNSWLYSDASTSTTMQQLYKKKFVTSGMHSYQLTASSNYGCSVSATSTNVIVYPLPTASFSNSFNCSTRLMSFTNTSVSNYSTLVISGSLWNLGQGPLNTSTLSSLSQSYTTNGTFTVKLVTSNSFGCRDSISSPIIIYPANQALFVKNNSCINDTVFLNNTSACNTGSCSYNWSFGDATHTSLLSPKKVYVSPGLYLVKLKAMNPVGCPDSVSTNVFVNPRPLAQFFSSTANVCPNNFVYFTNTSSISSGSISTYNWNFANATTGNNVNGTTSYSNAGIYSVSLTASSDSGCVNHFSLPVNVQSPPVAQYTVSPVCLGFPSNFVSTSIGVGLNYAWSFGNTVVTSTTSNASQVYNYPSAGIYTTQLIIFNAWGCSDTTSVMTQVISSPTAALGGSISTCGTSYTLNAGNTGSSYIWQPGNQTTSFITANNSGLYQVTITSTNGCTGTETVQLTLNSLVKPYLGNDSTVCGGFMLNAGYPGSSYLWTNSATTQTLLAASSGSYSVKVTDLNGCIGADTIHLIINTPPVLNLGNNITTCKPKYGLLLSPLTNANSFMWNTGATSSTINVMTNGNYWVEASATNGCKTKDTIQVTFLSTPQLNLGSDKSSCGNLLLDAQNNGATYTWNNGSSSQTLNAIISDTYWVTVTNTNTGCFQQDSINVVIYPVVYLFLGNDITVCNNSNFMLDANNPGATYIWTSGSLLQTIPVTSSAVYGVTVTNSGGCSASDYITINTVNAPVVNLGNAIRYLCGNNVVDLKVSAEGTANWGSNIGFTSALKSVSVTQPGKYWVTVNNFGCSSSDSVLIVPSSNTIQALFLASTQDTINRPVKFVNLSTPLPTSQLWSFGDGLTSNESSPLHTFVLPQDYSVTLEVSNGYCNDRITKQLSALFKQNSVLLRKPSASLDLLTFDLYPNPTNNYVQITIEFSEAVPIVLQICDLGGKLIFSKTNESHMNYSAVINLNEFKNGLYFLTLIAQSNKGNISKTLKLIKTN